MCNTGVLARVSGLEDEDIEGIYEGDVFAVIMVRCNSLTGAFAWLIERCT
jgi:hypothetical protein